MFLTEKEKAMAGGEYGQGIERCMDILVKFGDAFGAEKMVALSSAHTMPKEPPELLRYLTEDARQTGVYTTLHPMMSGFSPRNWQQMGIPEAFGTREISDCNEREAVYRRINFHQTYTCLPMLVGNFPLKGTYVSWIGTGAQLLVNSLAGARCNRDGTLVNLASALTGRAPYHGLFLDENRYADVLVKLDGIDPARLTHAELGAIGYHVGAMAGNRNVVVDGLSGAMTVEKLKYLMAPMSVSGSVSICHIAGLTPEAQTLEIALNRKQPKDEIRVSRQDIEESLNRYAGEDGPVDMALFGCPHCTVPEAKVLASLLADKKVDKNKRLWVGMPYQHYYLARQMGYVRAVEDAGGVFASACMATIPDAPIPEGVKTIATNSFKAAHYISRLTKGKVKVRVEDMTACVDAITGGKLKGGGI